MGFSAIEESADISAFETPAIARPSQVPVSEASPETAWRGELAQRLKAYRTRRGKSSDHQDQSSFSFGEFPVRSTAEAFSAPATIGVEETPIAPAEGEFSFTLAIGRSAKQATVDELPVEIDVSSQPETSLSVPEQTGQESSHVSAGLYPVASIDDRRFAAAIDVFCLLFAYGGFLGLFGSLGGHLTLSKLSAAVYISTFAVVYLQYFALFTIFGGTTPGMMMRGLQVVSFSGEPPAPRQMLLRSVGYLLSAGTFFLGFLWAMWDSDELTWHDRLSRTYLGVEQTLPELETSDAAHGR